MCEDVSDASLLVKRQHTYGTCFATLCEERPLTVIIDHGDDNDV